MICISWDCLVRNGAKSGAPGGIRTPDTWFRRPVLYPLSYERKIGITWEKSSTSGFCLVAAAPRRANLHK